MITDLSSRTGRSTFVGYLLRVLRAYCIVRRQKKKKFGLSFEPGKKKISGCIEHSTELASLTHDKFSAMLLVHYLSRCDQVGSKRLGRNSSLILQRIYFALCDHGPSWNRDRDLKTSIVRIFTQHHAKLRATGLVTVKHPHFSRTASLWIHHLISAAQDASAMRFGRK